MTELATGRQALAVDIPGDNPCGLWLRRDTVYREVKAAQEFEPGDPKYGIERRDPDWERVASLCETALTERTKDLYLGTCLVEAWARMRGAAGIRDGLWLLWVLHDKFWDGLHPLPRRTGDYHARAVLLESLRDRFQWIVLAIPVTAGQEPLTYGDWQHVGGKLPSGEPSPLREADRDQAVGTTPAEFYQQGVEAMSEAVRLAKELNAAVRERYQEAAIPMTERITKPLEEIVGIFQDLLAAKGGDPRLKGAREILRDTGATEAEPPPSPKENESERVIPRTLPRAGDAEGAIAQGCLQLIQQRQEDPSPYLCIRWLRWGPFVARRGAAPPEELPAPDASTRSQLASMFQNQQWGDLLTHSEELISGAPFGGSWLDLQRFSLAALRGLGRGRVRSTLLFAFDTFLTQCPWFISARLDDGTPAADEITSRWIANEVQKKEEAQTERKIPGEPGGDRSVAPIIAQARELLGREGSERALELLNTAQREASSERDRFALRVGLAQICRETGKTEAGVAILEGLRARACDAALRSWESPEFLSQPLVLLLEAYPAVSGNTASADRISTRMRELEMDLAKIDPARLLELKK